MTDAKPSHSEPHRRHRAWRWLARSLVGLVLLIVCLPWIIAATPLRHSVVTAVIADSQLKATVGKASLGWLSPLSLEQLDLQRSDGRMRVSVHRFSAEKSWLNLAAGAPDLGTLYLDRPLVEAVLGEDRPSAPRDRPRQARQTTLTAVVRSAGFKLRSPESDRPIIDLDGISTNVDIKLDGDRRLLTVAPVKILDHEDLTPELCGKGLQLVAPILNNATRVEGEISFALEQFRLPLDTTDQDVLARSTDIRGVVELHSVAAGLKSPMLVGLVGVISRLSGRPIPTRLNVVEDTRVAFHVEDGRVYHEGMTFVLPELSSQLSIVTSGSVGLDESLDLQVVVSVPADLLGDHPLGRRLAGKSVPLRITGTLDKPVVALENSEGLLAGVSSLLLRGQGRSRSSDDETTVADSIVDMVGGLLNEKPPGGDTQVGDWLERMKSRREVARKRRDAGRTGEPTRREGGWFRRRD